MVAHGLKSWQQVIVCGASKIDKVEVSFTDPGGNDESAASAATQIVALPGISSVELTSDPGDDQTYAIGETITATVTFDQEVAVTGSTQLTLRIGGGRPEEHNQAEYTGGAGTRALRFQYAVEENDKDEDGIFLERNELTLNGAAPSRTPPARWTFPWTTRGRARRKATTWTA